MTRLMTSVPPTFMTLYTIDRSKWPLGPTLDPIPSFDTRGVAGGMQPVIMRCHGLCNDANHARYRVFGAMGMGVAIPCSSRVAFNILPLSVYT